MWQRIRSLFVTTPPHHKEPVDPAQLDALADETYDPEQARRMLQQMEKTGGVTIEKLIGVSTYWRRHKPVGSDELYFRNAGIDLTDKMITVLEARAAR